MATRIFVLVEIPHPKPEVTKLHYTVMGDVLNLGGVSELELGTISNGVVNPHADTVYTTSVVVSFEEDDVLPAVALLEAEYHCECFFYTFGRKDGRITSNHKDV
jgi:hypothetical protein